MARLHKHRLFVTFAGYNEVPVAASERSSIPMRITGCQMESIQLILFIYDDSDYTAIDRMINHDPFRDGRIWDWSDKNHSFHADLDETSHLGESFRHSHHIRSFRRLRPLNHPRLLTAMWKKNT